MTYFISLTSIINILNVQEYNRNRIEMVEILNSRSCVNTLSYHCYQAFYITNKCIHNIMFNKKENYIHIRNVNHQIFRKYQKKNVFIKRSFVYLANSKTTPDAN